MTINWITSDKFAEITGLTHSYVRSCCNGGDWQEELAWRRLTDRIYLISLHWWDTWHETEAASKRRRQQALKSNSSMKGDDAESASNASPRLPTLED